MLESGTAILTLAFGLGLLHALDADHIAAVSALACGKRGRASAIGYSMQWAAGHSLTILLVGTGVYLFGQAIPDSLSAWAERLVGVVLLIIGSVVIWNIRKKDLHLHFHKHEGLPMHAHWHQASGAGNRTTRTHQHNHAPLFVGTLHGVAGSAPLLAIIPFSHQQDPWFGMTYLLIFCLGVFTTMLFFGGVVELLMRRLSRHTTRFFSSVQVIVGGASIGLGAWVIHGTF